MMLLVVLLSVAIASSALATNVLNAKRAEHYTRRIVPSDWSLSSLVAQPTESVLVHMLLKQQNVDVLEKRVLDAATPGLPTYGQWLSYSEVMSIVSPPAADLRKVVSWLSTNGARVQSFGDALKVTAPVSVLEKLFGAKLAAYERNNVREIKVMLGETLSMPVEIHQIVDMVLDITEFPVVDRIKPLLGHTPRDGEHVLPEVLQVAYKLPVGTYTFASNSSVAVAEFQADQGFIPSDLSNFQTNTLTPVAPVYKYLGPKPHTDNGDAEATLDVEYVSAVSIKANVWYYTTAKWLQSFATDFQAAPELPMAISMSWGWTESDQCSVGNCDFNAAKGTSQQYVERCNTEFAKITARGISLIAASGDQGAPGDGNSDCDKSGAASLSSLYPAASPWVTAVGATMFLGTDPHNVPTPASSMPSTTPSFDGKAKTPAPTPAPNHGTSPACRSQGCLSGYEEEVVCSYPKALITSGGGFSDYVATPSWQAAAVANYLKVATDLPPASDFKANTRAYPDVSAAGHAVLIKLMDQWEAVDGTSCSAPIFCGIVGLLNDARINAGKPVLGFLNPLLYQMGTAPAATSPFKDITVGNNKATEGCVNKVGYTASVGWDATTGWGSPNFPNMLAYVQALPQ